MGFLMMSATIGIVGSAFVLLIFALWKKMFWLRDFALGATAIWFAIYAVVLFGVSLTSEDGVLHGRNYFKLEQQTQTVSVR